jgi:HEAT repeat protein
MDFRSLLHSQSEEERKKAILLLAKAPVKEHLFLLQNLAESDESVELRFLARKAIQAVKSAILPEGISKPSTSPVSQPVVFSAASGEEKVAIVHEIVRKGLHKNLISLRGMLKSESDPTVLSAILPAIGKFGSEADIQSFEPFLQHPSPRVRANAIEALELIGSNKVFPYIMSCLDDSDNRVRTNAMKAVRQLSPLLIQRMVRAMVKAPVQSLRASAAYVLRFLPSEQSVGLLIELVESRVPPVRESALKSMKILAEKGIAKAQLFLTQSNIAVPSAEKTSLEDFHHQNTQQDTAFRDAGRELEDSDSRVRFEAILKLTALGGAGLADLLIKRLYAEKDLKIMAKIILTLGQIHCEKALPILKKLLLHKDPRCRANTVEAIGLLGNKNASSALIPYLEDPNNRVRANAVLALANVPGTDISRPLLAMVSSDDSLMQRTAVFCLTELSRSEFLPLLFPLSRSHFPEVRDAAQESLRKLSDLGVVVEEEHEEPACQAGVAGEIQSQQFSSNLSTCFTLLRSTICQEGFEQAFDLIKTIQEQSEFSEKTTLAAAALGRTIRQGVSEALQAGIRRATFSLKSTLINTDRLVRSRRLPGNCGGCGSRVQGGFFRFSWQGIEGTLCATCGERINEEQARSKQEFQEKLKNFSGFIAFSNDVLSDEIGDQRVVKLFGQFLLPPPRKTLIFQQRTQTLEVKDLSAILENPASDEHDAALQAIRHMGSAALEAVPALCGFFMRKPDMNTAEFITIIEAVSPEWPSHDAVREISSELCARLLPNLLAKEPGDRQRALNWLKVLETQARSGTDVSILVGPISQKLREPPSEKLFALAVVEVFPSLGERCLSAMLPLLTFENPGIRIQAEKTLSDAVPGWRESPDLQEFLFHLAPRLKHAKGGELETIFSLLTALGPTARKVVPVMNELWRETHDAEKSVPLEKALVAIDPQAVIKLKRQRWIRRGWRAGLAGISGIFLIIGYLFAGLSVFENPSSAIRLWKMGLIDHQRAMKCLAVTLGTAEWKVREDALNFLSTAGLPKDVVLPGLIAVIKENSRGLGEKIVGVLSDISPKWRESRWFSLELSVLIEQLQSRDREIRGKARQTLDLMDPSWTGRRETRQAIPGIFAKLLESDNELHAIRVEVLGNLASSVADLPEVTAMIPLLRESSDDPDHKVREHAIQAISLLGPAGKPALGEVITAMTDTATKTRMVATRFLETHFPDWPATTEAHESVGSLCVMLANGDHSQRSEAERILLKIGPHSKRVQDELLAIISQEKSDRHDDDLMLRSVNTLNGTSPDWTQTDSGRAFLVEIVRHFSDGAFERRLARIKLAGMLGPTARQFSPVLQEALLDKLSKIRSEALVALNQVEPEWRTSEGGRNLLRKWSSLLDRVPDEEKVRLIEVLGLLKDFSRPLLGKVTKAFFNNDDRVSQTAFSVLPLVDPSWQSNLEVKEAVAVACHDLHRFRDEEKCAFLVKVQAVGEAGEKAVPYILPLLHSREPGVQLLAIDTLGKMKEKAGPAASALEELLDHHQKKVQVLAHLALKAINPKGYAHLPDYSYLLKSDEAWEEFFVEKSPHREAY